jgi:hypothetical protein
MNSLLINLFALVACGTYLTSFLSFDRLLRIEARLHPDNWQRDGRPVGIYTWAKEVGAKLHPSYDIAALLSFFRLYSLWLFRTPGWVRQAPAAHRILWTARSLSWLLVVEVTVFKELM